MWRKSSFCNGASACVLVALLADGNVGVRDSKLGDASPVLVVPAADWAVFVEPIRRRVLGLADGLVRCRRVKDGWRMWLTSNDETALLFADAEMVAFVEGVRADEFTPEALAAGDGSGVDGLSLAPGSTLAGL